MVGAQMIVKEAVEKIKRWYVFWQSGYAVTTPEGAVLRMCNADISSTPAGNEGDKGNKPQNQRKWVREEMVLLVTEYFRTKNLSNKEKQESIQMISRVLRQRAINNGEQISETFRNINGIQMQTACIMKYDPEVMRTTENAGLSGGSRLMFDVVKEYIRNPDKVKAEAYECIASYGTS